MSLGDERDLVPLGAGFDFEKRGYSRGQVDEHLERLDADLRMLTSDRDAAISQAGDLAKQLESARVEIDDLRGQVDRLAQPPTTIEGLSERLQRMLRLAQEEAADTQARAEAEAGHIRAKAEADASAMRARYEQLLTELAERRREMEAEHRKVIADARAEADSTLTKAKEERDRLDTEAEQRRTKVDEDFEIAMATRRTEAMRELAEQEAASKAEAERRLREATDEATAIRTEVAEEESTAKADIERRQRESVEDANRRKQNSISEANARVAEATDEANRRVREATEEANRRVREATDIGKRRVADAKGKVEALQTLRRKVADQVVSARSMLAEVDSAIEGKQPGSDSAQAKRNGQKTPAGASSGAVGSEATHE